jgi:hypothetical protein
VSAVLAETAAAEQVERVRWERLEAPTRVAAQVAMELVLVQVPEAKVVLELLLFDT